MYVCMYVCTVCVCTNDVVSMYLHIANRGSAWIECSVGHWRCVFWTSSGTSWCANLRQSRATHFLYMMDKLLICVCGVPVACKDCISVFSRCVFLFLYSFPMFIFRHIACVCYRARHRRIRWQCTSLGNFLATGGDHKSRNFCVDFPGNSVCRYVYAP